MWGGQYFDTSAHNLVQSCGNPFHQLRRLCFSTSTPVPREPRRFSETGGRSVSLVGIVTDKPPPHANCQSILNERES